MTRESVLSLAARLTAEVVTNALVVAARVADWALDQIQSDTKRFLTMGGSEWYATGPTEWMEDYAGEYDDEPSVRECPCGETLFRFVVCDLDEQVDWRHENGIRACDDVARELFEIKWEKYPGGGMSTPAINPKAYALLKSDPDEYFRLSRIWRERPKE